MKIVFQGLEEPLWVDHANPLLLEVGNPTLFARLCRSLESNEGEFAMEPYTLWEQDERMKEQEAFLFIVDPLNLPWDVRGASAFLFRQIEALLEEDEETRLSIERINAELRSICFSGSCSLLADYSFGAEWDIKKYLKSFSFGVRYNKADTLLDNLIGFLDFVADMRLGRMLTFVNLCSFLSKNDMMAFLERAFFLNLPIVLLEGDARGFRLPRGVHYRIDQELLGTFVATKSGCPSSGREDFAPTVLEQ